MNNCAYITYQYSAIDNKRILKPDIITQWIDCITLWYSFKSVVSVQKVYRKMVKTCTLTKFTFVCPKWQPVKEVRQGVRVEANSRVEGVAVLLTMMGR